MAKSNLKKEIFRINADKEGNVLSWGTETIGEEFDKNLLPSDFTNGKYLFVNKEIVLNENYIKSNK
jgi:hypothetical protein